ncbi:hypothetical protein OKA05_00965 [Luteolibacter arcticus]|uniref:ABC transporter permease n=1 Tax=Luteolibacter arcticus TaxID=1581411 RepID=A0ABT3GBU6_9BACT|nr:hypothetical protein [Luteolibacter arcticus]MCW1921102.1 hypothetical protein [Luteolibacter arcticus]
MTAADSQTHRVWQVWKNPIFHRYCRSRLRPRALGLASLITGLIAGFIVFMANSGGVRAGLSPSDAARIALLFLLGFQCVILFIFGTAQAAGGMTAERDEGVIDYQRLIPMSPLSKVLGFLFGLPVREYAMFLIILPFAAWALWLGEISWHVWLPLYAIIFTSAVTYHLTGLVTGTVVKNRRWAFLLSIGIVFCLYTIIPQMAKVGLVYFKYLTIWPVIEESLPKLLPRTAGSALETLQNLAPTAKFFGLDFSEAVFTFFSQLGLILTFLVMLCRKWRRSESHLLGKVWATGFYVWIQIQLLGNSLPLVDAGSVFPSKAFNRMMRVRPGWNPDPGEAVAMSGIYGVISLILIFIFASIITPSADSQVRGWRRARKQGVNSLPFFSDAATGFWAVLMMSLAGAAGWFFFTRGLVESRWFPGHVVPLRFFFFNVLVMVAAGVGYQVLLEAKGGRVVGLVTIFVGVVPVMAGAVIVPISERLAPLAVWLFGMSPASLPVFASASLLSLSELPHEVARAVPRAFQFWLFVTTLACLWRIGQLWLSRKEKARSVLDGEVVAERTLGAKD